MIGIDEVGRGPLAGPVVAAAVALPTGYRIRGVRDSKLLSRLQRNQLCHLIRHRALAVGIGWASHNYIDQQGLTAATRAAMCQALDSIQLDWDEIIIDGSFNYLSETYPVAQTVVKADIYIPAVSAASIIAKVSRDNFMIKASQIYPGYGFERHVGYGTKSHRRRLNELGPAPIHRLSFRPLWHLPV